MNDSRNCRFDFYNITRGMSIVKLRKKITSLYAIALSFLQRNSTDLIFVSIYDDNLFKTVYVFLKSISMNMWFLFY